MSHRTGFNESLTTLLLYIYIYIYIHIEWWSCRSESLTGRQLRSGMSYRKWSRIRLPVRPIAPVGGYTAGCYGAQGDDNNKGRVALDSAFTTHSRVGPTAVSGFLSPWMLDGGQYSEFLHIWHVLGSNLNSVHSLRLMQMEAWKAYFPQLIYWSVCLKLFKNVSI